MTNIQSDSKTPATIRESFHPVTRQFYREINSLKDVGALITDHVSKSRQKGWKTVSIPYSDAEACVSQIDESAENVSEIFEATKQSAILAEKNRAISEELLLHPLQATFKKFVAGMIGKEELSNHINKVFGVRKTQAA